MKAPNRHQWYTCPHCGKRAYYTKTGARAAKKALTGLHLYRCRSGSGWHAGHLPAVVRRGEVSKHDIYPQLPRPALPGVPDDLRPWTSREAYAHDMFDLGAA